MDKIDINSTYLFENGAAPKNGIATLNLIINEIKAITAKALQLLISLKVK